MARRGARARIARRDFFAVAWALSLSALAGQGVTAVYQFIKPRVRPGSFGGEVIAGNLEEFPLGSVSYILGGRCYVVRLQAGGLLALWQRCTHLGCAVPWREEQDQFNCPCHSSLFDRVGVVTGGPAPRPLDLFPLRMEDGLLIIDTGKPIERSEFSESQVFYPPEAS